MCKERNNYSDSLHVFFSLFCFWDLDEHMPYITWQYWRRNIIAIFSVLFGFFFGLITSPSINWLHAILGSVPLWSLFNIPYFSLIFLIFFYHCSVSLSFFFFFFAAFGPVFCWLLSWCCYLLCCFFFFLAFFLAFCSIFVRFLSFAASPEMRLSRRLRKLEPKRLESRQTRLQGDSGSLFILTI